MATASEPLAESSRHSVTEHLRNQSVAGLLSLDPGRDADFKRLTRLAAVRFGVPVGVVALLEAERLWLFAQHGLEIGEVASEGSLVAATVTSPDLTFLVVPDAAADHRFARDPLVVGEPKIRFYAGAPIVVHGQKIGALCVMSPLPGQAPDEGVLVDLLELAGLAASLFELKDEARVRARMAADLIKEEWRHALTLEAGKVGSWVWDLRTGEIVSNDIFRQMFGLSVANPLHITDLMASIDPADVEGVNAALEDTFEAGGDFSVEFRVAGTGRWLIGRGRVYQRDGAGKPLIMMGVNIDVTDAREAAEHTRVLLRELNHRVKNTLAMIQSLARQTMRQSPDPQSFIDAFSGRLRTLSDAHAMLSDQDWSGIGLIDLIRSQVEPYLASSPDQLTLSGADVRLPPDHGLGLGLVLHELTSNAVKFGALSTPAGRAEIVWTVSERPKRRLELRWTERGGPPVSEVVNPSFGVRLIQRGLDKVLDSSVELSFAPGGVTATISLPLD